MASANVSSNFEAHRYCLLWQKQIPIAEDLVVAVGHEGVISLANHVARKQVVEEFPCYRSTWI